MSRPIHRERRRLWDRHMCGYSSDSFGPSNGPKAADWGVDGVAVSIGSE